MEINSVVHVDEHSYRVRDIKHGGMGNVYILQQMESGWISDPVYRSYVAVKTFTTENNREPNKDLIRNELNVWISLNHPNILPLTKIVSINFFTGALMPLRAGSLQEEISLGHRFHPDEVIRIAQQIVQALSFALSECCVLHLDIKPGNILLYSNTENKPHYQISDWGIASIQKELALHKNHAGSWLLKDWSTVFSNFGTLPYMAPERFLPEFRAVPACDIFSIGMVLLQLLTGTLPYVHGNIEFDEQIISGVFYDNAEMLLRSLKSDRLRQLILQCIHPIIAQRYNDYTSLIKDIKSLQSPLFHFFHSLKP